MMRALSNNMTDHALFLSTPKFISDLLFVSEVLKGIEKPERDGYLKSVIEEINKNLPSNVYIPIMQETTNLPDPSLSKKARRQSKLGLTLQKQKISATRMHRVLRISPDNAFCLHSKERVPYHIIIEVAYDHEEKEDDEHVENTSFVEGDNPFEQAQNAKDRSGIWALDKRKFSKRKSDVELDDIKKPRSASKDNLRDLAAKIKLPSKTFFGDANNNTNSAYIIDAHEDLGKNFIDKPHKRSKSII
jgi:hypothetical protein